MHNQLLRKVKGQEKASSREATTMWCEGVQKEVPLAQRQVACLEIIYQKSIADEDMLKRQAFVKEKRK